MKKLGQRWVNAIERSDSINEWIPFVTEISAGSRQKYALDKRSGQLVLHRALADGITYPTNYGFIPRTRAEADGMELDLMALTAEPLVPLAIAKVRIVGGCSLSSDAKPREDKLLGVVFDDPSVAKVKDIGDVDPKLKARIEQFFTTFKQDEGVAMRFERWFDRPMAIEKLKQGFALAKYARHK